MLILASSLAQDVVALRSCQFGSQWRCSATPPRPLDQVEEEPAAMAVDIQPSPEEFVEQPSLPSSPHSLAEMQASAIVHGSPSLPPQSHAQSYPYPNLGVVEEVQKVGTTTSGSQSNIPTNIRRSKWTAKQIVKHPTIFKSPFVAQCLK